MSRRTQLLLSLSFASGVCGLAYEVLYTRMLTTYLGDMLQVSAGILATFLLGLGIGSLVAYRAYRWLWLIEAGIGVYGMLAAWLVSSLPPAELATLLAGGGGVHVVVSVALVVAVPSMLIGCSIPLFTAYLGAERSLGDESQRFARVYAWYNLGAACCVLVLELVLLRALGLRNSALTIAAINLATALLLRLYHEPAAHAPASPSFSSTLARWDFLALFVVSALSATYQLLVLRFCTSVFGPYHENFALLLCFVLSGLSLGAWIVRRWDIGLPKLLVVGSVVVGFSAVLLGDEARLWAHLSDLTAEGQISRTPLKALLIGAMSLPSFTVFGATVPALLTSDTRTRRDPGGALAVSSFGNCVGYLATVLILLRAVPLQWLLFSIAALTCAIGVAISTTRRRERGMLAASALLTLGVLLDARWPDTYLALGHMSFLSSKRLHDAEAKYLRSDVIRRLDGDVSIVQTKDGVEYVTINGYTSFTASQGGVANHREVLVGITPTLYPAERRHALVLGTGTGITAGAVATQFEHTTVVEISPAVFEALPRFSKYNFGLSERDDVDLVLDDGLAKLARDPTRYNLVLSTVTSPLYFASSKLYTKNFFELVKSRLTPDGVFAFWFDARLSAEGTKVMLQTIEESFADCHFVFLLESYYEAICADQPLTPKPRGQWSDAIRDTLSLWTIELDVDRLLDHLVLRPTHLSGVHWYDEVNTFDRPVLEQVMARKPLSDWAEWDLDQWLQFDLEHGGVSQRGLDDLGLAERCHVLARVGMGRALPRCGPLLDRHQQAGWNHFVDLTLETIATTGRSVMPYRDLLAALVARDDLERALMLLEKKKKRTLGQELQKLHLMLKVRGEVSDAAVARLLLNAPLWADARRFMIELAMQRGQPRIALEHMAFLARLEPLTDRDQKLYARIRAEIGRSPP